MDSTSRRAISLRFLVPALLAMLSCTVYGAALGIKDEYTIRRWGVEDGLPEGIVTSVTQFPDGFLWLTTSRHVVRFDGVRFEYIDEGGFPEQRPDIFSGLYRDRRGNVWVYGEGGAMRYAGGKWALIPVFDGKSTWRPVIHWVRESPDGQLWASSNRGMCRFDGRCFMLVPIVLPNRPKPPTISSAAMDSQGCVWLAAWDCVLRFAKGSYECVRLPYGSSITAIDRVATGEGNSVYIHAWKRLLCYRDGCWTDMEPIRVNALVQKTPEEVWLGSAEGLARWRDGRMEQLVGKIGEVPAAVQCVFMMREGILWAGASGGLYRLSPRMVRMVGPSSEVWSDPVGAVRIRSNGTVACSVDGTSSLFTGSPGSMLGVPLIPKFEISSIWEASDKTLWLGSRSDHLWCYDLKRLPRQFTCHHWDWNGYKSRSINCVLGTSNGTLWVGSREGVLFLEGDDCLVSVPGAGDSVMTLAEDVGGKLWAGTQSSGLWQVTTGGVQRVVRTTDGLPSDTVRLIQCESNGVMWVGTPKGLGRIQTIDYRLQTTDGKVAFLGTTPGKWSAEPATQWNNQASDHGFAGSPRQKIFSFTREHGLPGDDIRQLLDDGQGNLWIGTRQEIYRIAKSDLDAVAVGRNSAVSVRVFGREEGVAAELTGGGAGGSLTARMGDGTLWFATRSGLARIDPAHLSADPPQPPVYVEGIDCGPKTTDRKLKGRAGEPAAVTPAPGTRPSSIGLRFDVCGLTSVSLPSGSRDIKFHFNTPDYHAPERVRFRTMLEGYDSEWSRATAERTVVYPRLPPGEYTFRVMRGRAGGSWREAENSMRVVIEPFFWQTWWFMGGFGFTALVLTGVLSGMLVRRRARRKLLAVERQRAAERAVENERARIARDIHDELGSGLTRIMLLSQGDEPEQASGAGPTAGGNAIFRTARELIRSMDELVWVINPQHDAVESLVSYISRYAINFLGAAGVRCRLDMPSELIDVPVASPVRHQLLLALKEALRNAVTHGKATEITVALGLAGNTMSLIVEDNGGGFDPEHLPKSLTGGNGLVNMRQRLEALGGGVEIRSRPGQGARLRLWVPV